MGDAPESAGITTNELSIDLMLDVLPPFLVRKMAESLDGKAFRIATDVKNTQAEQQSIQKVILNTAGVDISTLLISTARARIQTSALSMRIVAEL